MLTRLMFVKTFICLIYPVFLLLGGCDNRKTITVSDSKTGNILSKQVLITRDNDTLLDGLSLVIDPSSDTLELKRFRKNVLEYEMSYDRQKELTRGQDHITGELYEKKMAGGRPLYEKKLKGDSLVFWHYWDARGNKYTFNQWHKKNSDNIYRAYIEYFNKFRDMPETYTFRILAVPARGYPGMVDYIDDDKIRLYFFDFEDDKFEFKERYLGHTWKMYTAQLKLLEKSPSHEVKGLVNGYLKEKKTGDNIIVDLQSSTRDAFYIRASNGTITEDVHVPADKIPAPIKSILAASGYKASSDSVERKLNQWKKEKENYYLEEVMQLRLEL